MTLITKLPMRTLLLFTTVPALIVGAALWFTADLVPQCTIVERDRQTSPDNQFDVVIFSRDCGNTTANIQAALVPTGEDMPYDATSFLSLGADADLAPRWDAGGNLELTVPEGVEIYRQDDAVAGVTVIYR